MENFKIIEPREGAKNHIDSHKNINVALLSFTAEISKLKTELDKISKENKRLDRFISNEISNFSNQIKKLEYFVETRMDGILDRLEKPRQKEVIMKTYEGIADTTSENELSLDIIEFSHQGQYKVDIIQREVKQNNNVEEYFLPESVITDGGFTPRIGIKSSGGKAVMEYKFKVLIHEL